MDALIFELRKILDAALGLSDRAPCGVNATSDASVARDLSNRASCERCAAWRHASTTRSRMLAWLGASDVSAAAGVMAISPRILYSVVKERAIYRPAARPLQSRGDLRSRIGPRLPATPRHPAYQECDFPTPAFSRDRFDAFFGNQRRRGSELHHGQSNWTKAWSEHVYEPVLPNSFVDEESLRQLVEPLAGLGQQLADRLQPFSDQVLHFLIDPRRSVVAIVTPLS